MVGRTLTWSPEAEIHLNEILTFYQDRNGNSDYGDNLLYRIESVLSSIVAQPYWGEQARQRGFRFVVVTPFQLFYYVTKTEIVVAAVWDGRRDPKTLKLIR